MWRKASYRKAIVLRFGTLAGALLMASTAAHAVPVELSFSGTVRGSNVPGATNGAAMTFDVFADNGGDSLISQTWTATTITGATMQAGTYSAATSGPLSFSFGSFSTNASGQLQTLNFVIDQNGSDTNGRSFFNYFMDGAPFNLWFAANSSSGPFTSLGAVSPPTITNTTISLVAPPSEIPLPAALPLFGSGLGALGLLGWRRKRKSTTSVLAA